MKLTDHCISLKGLRFFAHHGVAPQERVVGNEYILNIRLQADLQRASETDDVADTVSYADVYEVVKAEMAIPSRLLEHVCARIIHRLLAVFPQVESVTVCLAKRNPPMGADIEVAEVEMRGER